MSSSLTWPTQIVLRIGIWSGSPYGGGNQRIIFGTNNAALTAQQLPQRLTLSCRPPVEAQPAQFLEK